MQVQASGQKISYTKAIKNANVKNMKGLIKTFRKALREVYTDKKDQYYYEHFKMIDETLSDKELEKIIIKAFEKYISPVYKDEGEWAVKGGKLKIPKKSRLFVLVRFDDKMIQKYKNDELDEYEKMRYEDDLYLEINFRRELEQATKGKYIVKYVDIREWEKVRTIHITKKYNS